MLGLVTVREILIIFHLHYYILRIYIPGCGCRLLVQGVHLQDGEQNSSSLQHLHRLVEQPIVHFQVFLFVQIVFILLEERL